MRVAVVEHAARGSRGGAAITAPDLSGFAREDFCYVTTTGRRTGNEHTIEIWFGVDDASLYLLAGDHRSDSVLNIKRNPKVTVRIRDRNFAGVARVVADEEESQRARRLLAAKYQGWREGQPLSEWAATALVVAIEV